MFNKLQKKWNVNGFQLFLIICTFAIGGSVCGKISSFILDLFSINNTFIKVLLYLLLVTLLWPLCVIIISIPLGQFKFFKSYLLKVFARLTGNKSNSHD
jgi:uncharacterized membrane protein YwzB